MIEGTSRRLWSQRVALGCATGLLVVSAVATPAAATHFRYGHITWKHATSPPNTIEFTLQNAWRFDGVTAGNYECVDTAQAGLPNKPCTGPGGNPGMNDVFVEFQGNTVFEFGDSATVGSPRGPLAYLVTSIDPTNNWLFGLAIDPNSLPAVDTTIQHTYANATARTARINDSARISACTAPNAHMNNPDNNYRVETRVDVGSGNSSPASSLPPIIFCPQNGICTFPISVSDNENDTLSFRMSTTTEAQFTSQPGAPQCPAGHAASINPTTGVYTWDTGGCRLAGDPTPVPPAGGCNNANLNTLYSTQIMIEEPARGTHTAVDFMIQLVASCAVNTAPAFDHPPTPACGSTVSARPGVPVTFGIRASDVNGADSVALTVAGLPSGATLTPSLPLGANPVSTTLAWTPTAADIGQHVLTFSATDPCNTQALCATTIDVSQEICGDGLDNDNDTLIDCADPDCNGTPCDDGEYCSVGDTCQAGTCSGSMRDCSDGNTCTADSCDEVNDTCGHDAAPLNGTACNDNNSCTDNDLCSGGTCAGTPHNCSDGNACNGAEVCDQVLGCQPGPPLNCDDGNVCNGTETCVAPGGCVAGTPLTCGDGNPCNGTEACDPQLGCQFGPPPSCNDGNVCNGVETCVPFVGCTAGTALNCDDGDPCSVDTCDPTGGCGNAAPGTTCRQAGRSSLWLRNRSLDRKDKFIWRWGRGDTPLAELGDPINGSSGFAVCLYDEATPSVPALIAKMVFPPGGTCIRGKPCWQKIYGGAAVKGFKYKDRPNGGNLRLVLNEGTKNRARMRMIGQGGSLDLPLVTSNPLMSQNQKITVQLVSSDGLCWEAKFSPPAKKNIADEFIDRCSRGRQGTCQ